jgi:hypothetical protein
LSQQVSPRKLLELRKVCVLLFYWINVFSSEIEENYVHKKSYTAGKYYYLPNASDAVVSMATREALSALKSSWNWMRSNQPWPPLPIFYNVIVNCATINVWWEESIFESQVRFFPFIIRFCF